MREPHLAKLFWSCFVTFWPFYCDSQRESALDFGTTPFVYCFSTWLWNICWIKGHKVPGPLLALTGALCLSWSITYQAAGHFLEIWHGTWHIRGAPQKMAFNRTTIRDEFVFFHTPLHIRGVWKNTNSPKYCMWRCAGTTEQSCNFFTKWNLNFQKIGKNTKK